MLGVFYFYFAYISQALRLKKYLTHILICYLLSALK